MYGVIKAPLAFLVWGVHYRYICVDHLYIVGFYGSKRKHGFFLRFTKNHNFLCVAFLLSVSISNEFHFSGVHGAMNRSGSLSMFT